MPRTGTQETPRAAEIATVSARLFRKVGYRETTVRDIARALDMKSASLYYHFERKDDILFAIAHGLMRDFVRDVTPMLTAQDDPVEAISTVVDAHLRFDFARLDQVLVSARERRSLPADMQRPINALRARHRHAMKRRIVDGVERGKFDVEDPSLAASAVLDLLTGVKEWYHPPRDGRLEGLVAAYQRFVLSLLGHRE